MMCYAEACSELELYHSKSMCIEYNKKLSPLVSIIIPTKNSDEFLDRVLINLMEQDYPDKEIIVVDNFSTDNTPEIATRWADRFFQVGPERANQDNYGISMARGAIIYLTGSDMLRDIDYVSQGVKKLEEGYQAIYASVLTDWRVKHFWGEVKALERRCYIGSKFESARMFYKDVFLVRGGFDNNLVGVEEDFQHRLDRFGYKTGRIDAREYHLHEETNLGDVFKKSFYYGKYSRNYLTKHKLKGISFLLPARSCFFKNWLEFIKHPILGIGLIIYKFVQYLAGGLGVLYGTKK